jgi:hypothetical protein
MQVLREISAQTIDATSANSQSVLKLADLSAALRKAAAGFRLPPAVSSTSTNRVLAVPDGGTGTHRAVKAASGP